MSAFVLPDEHLHYLTAAALEWNCGIGHSGEADAFGAMLRAENVASVNARYPALVDEPNQYRFDRRPRAIDPVSVLKAVACYEYQSCERDDWDESIVRARCESLRMEAIRRLPGYDAAPWVLEGLPGGVDAR